MSKPAVIGRSMAEDIQSVARRVSNVLKGNVKYVDIGTQQGLRLVASLEAIAIELRTAIITAKE